MLMPPKPTPVVCIDTHWRLRNAASVCTITHLNSADVISALRADGWFKVGQKGDHVQFKHPTKKGRVTVTAPKRDIPIGTLRSIEKQSGLRLRP